MLVDKVFAVLVWTSMIKLKYTILPHILQSRSTAVIITGMQSSYVHPRCYAMA